MIRDAAAKYSSETREMLAIRYLTR